MGLIGAIIFIYCLCAFFAWLSDEMKKEDLEERSRKIWQDFERQAQEEQGNYRKMLQRENEEQVQLHKNYINYYRTSKEVETLIEALCNGSRMLYIPDQIEIYDDRVESTINSIKIVCNYSDFGLKNMNKVCWGGSTENFRYVCRPQIVLANVINQKFHGIYQIKDLAKFDFREHESKYSNKTQRLLVYTSNCVVLAMK